MNFCPDKQLLRGDYDYRIANNDLVVFKWMDQKPVYLISNFMKIAKLLEP